MTQPTVADLPDVATEPVDDPTPFVLPEHLRSSLAPELLATLDKLSAEAPPDAADGETPPDAKAPASPDEQFETVGKAIARRNILQNEFRSQCGLSSGYTSQLLGSTRLVGPGARRALMDALHWDFDQLFEEAPEDA